MGLFRGRDDEPHQKFQMREKMIAIGDDYWIEDESGDKVFKVNGKALGSATRGSSRTPAGNTVAEIQEKKLSVRDKIKIELPGGRSASVKKAMIGIRERFHVEVNDGPDMKVHGNIVDHEYEIERDGDKIAEISKKWFRIRDTYGVEIFDTKETVLVLVDHRRRGRARPRPALIGPNTIRRSFTRRIGWADWVGDPGCGITSRYGTNVSRGPVSGTANTPRKRRPFLIDFYSTAVGKKYVMAITGIIGSASWSPT